MLIYDEKPTVGGDRELQEVMGGFQGHPARCIGKDYAAICEMQIANI